MKKLGLGLCLVLALGACGPRDVAQKSGRNSNSGGGSGNDAAVKGLAANNGEKLPSCYSNTVFEYLNSPLDLDGKIFAGKIKGQWKTGDFNCFIVGSTVNLQNNSKNVTDKPIRAKLKITKLQVLSPDELTEAHAAAVNMTLDALKAEVKEKVNGNESAKGVIHFTFFEVVPGSFDPSVIKPSDLQATPVDVPSSNEGGDDTETAASAGYIKLISKVGARSPTCPEKTKDYGFIINPEEKDADILAGKVKAILTAGERNCYRIGAVLSFKNSTKKSDDDPERFKAVITQVQIVPLDQLNESHASAMNMTLAELEEYAAAENEKVKSLPKPFPTNNTVNITYFELVGQQQPAVQQTPAEEEAQ